MIFFTIFDLYKSAIESLFSQILRIGNFFSDQLEPTFLANFYAYNRKQLFRLVETIGASLVGKAGFSITHGNM